MLSRPSATTATVAYATSSGTATASDDYVADSGTLTFEPGVITKTITIDIQDDADDENDETMLVSLSDASNVSVGTPDTAIVTIHDDDGAPEVRFRQSEYSLSEDGGQATMEVFLSRALGTPITVNYATKDGTATEAEDYVAANGTLVFAPGETSKFLSIVVIDDAIDEENETILVELSIPDGAAGALADNICYINNY